MFKCGEKFTITNCTIDVEITGYFPKSQSKDGKDYYVATLNGERMKIAASFIEMLQQAQVKEEKAEEVKQEVVEEKAVEEKAVAKPKKERKNGRKRNAKA
jgi:hypothetical protein